MNPEIELRHLRYFIAVAEELHFGRAAEKLGIAQPPLSQQIKRLEERLECSLFTRTTRGVSLTAAGAVLLDRAQATLSKVVDDISITRKMASDQMGTLTIGFSGSVMLTGLAAILKEYRQKYPQVDLRLRELSTSEQLDALHNGIIDVGLMRDGMPSSKLKMTTLLREPFVVVLPIHHRLASQRTIRVSALAGQPFVLFPRSAGCISYDKVIKLCLRAGFSAQVFQEALQWTTIVSLVEAGLGLSIAPASVSNLQKRGVVYRKLLSTQDTSDISMAIPHHYHHKLVQSFETLVQSDRLRFGRFVMRKMARKLR